MTRAPVCHWCGGPPKKGVTSRIMPAIHSVCDDCGEEEYQKCLKLSGFKAADVRAAQERYNNKGGGMTFTLHKMSGKGIRMLARYLAVTKLVGDMDLTPEEFYNQYMRATGQTRRQCEEGFVACTDKYEERLRDEDGYMSSKAVQDVAAFVQKKLGPGMWIEAEVAADHHRNGVDVPVRRQVKSQVAPKGNVGTLLKQLKSCTDPEAKRKLRRQLRKLGHRGGSR